MVKVHGPVGKGSTPLQGGEDLKASPQLCPSLLPPLWAMGAVWIGDVWGFLSSSSSGTERWAGQAGCTVAMVADELQEQSQPSASVKTNTR